MQTVGLKNNRVRDYLIDLTKALHYCHKTIGVIHRDIKPDNIMVNHNDEAVLIDFGVSALVEEADYELLERKMGSYMFFAPELFKRKNTLNTDPNVDRKQAMTRGEATDIWALGVTIYYLLTGRYPCEDALDPLQLRDFIIDRPIDFDLIKSEQPRQLVKLMLDKDPAKRASLQAILASPWITRGGKENQDFSVEISDTVESLSPDRARLELPRFGNLQRLLQQRSISYNQPDFPYS